MSDWRQTGQRLHHKWLELKREHMQKTEQKYPDLVHRLENSFMGAMSEYVHGDPTRLAAYLRSNQPLSTSDREHLAMALEGGFTIPAPRGRPRNEAVHSAAIAAEVFYRSWRTENERNGIEDWGCRDKMKNEAIRIAIEVERLDVDFEAVRELMDRPKSRRK